MVVVGQPDQLSSRKEALASCLASGRELVVYEASTPLDQRPHCGWVPSHAYVCPFEQT